MGFILSILHDLSDLRDINKFELKCSKEAENKIQRQLKIKILYLQKVII